MVKTLHLLIMFGSSSPLLRCHIPENISLMESLFSCFANKCGQNSATNCWHSCTVFLQIHCHDMPPQCMCFILILLVFKFCIFQFNNFTCSCAQNSIVSRATCYRQDCSGDRICVGVRVFVAHPDQLWGPPRLLYNVQWALCLFSRDNSARTWCCPPTPI
jgi:hypothetical protein